MSPARTVAAPELHRVGGGGQQEIVSVNFPSWPAPSRVLEKGRNEAKEE